MWLFYNYNYIFQAALWQCVCVWLYIIMMAFLNVFSFYIRYLWIKGGWVILGKDRWLLPLICRLLVFDEKEKCNQMDKNKQQLYVRGLCLANFSNSENYNSTLNLTSCGAPVLTQLE